MKTDDLEISGHPSADKAMTLIQRYKRRVKWLATLAVSLWVLATGSGVLFVSFFFVYLYPRLMHMLKTGKAENMADSWNIIGEWSFNWLVGTGLVGMLAGVCTVLLILASNQASMTQLHATLRDISEKIKNLQPPPPKEQLP